MSREQISVDKMDWYCGMILAPIARLRTI